MLRTIPLLSFFALVAITPAAGAATVRVHPDTVWIERGRGEQFVSCDFEGLPSRFERVDRWIGDRRVPVKDGFVTTGDLLESR